MGAPQYEQAGADIGGTGTPNTIPRWTGVSTLGDSILTQTGSTRITVGSGAYAGASVDGFRVANGADSYIAASDGTRTLLMGANGAQVLIGSLTNHSVVVKTNNIDAMTILPGAAGVGGNVGIGTASPNDRVEVNGNARFTRPNVASQYLQYYGDATYNALVSVSSSKTFALFSDANSAGMLLQTQAAQPIVLATNNLERARIDSSGNLILNSANTGATIQAAGSQQGLKLPATPGNADTQTLDAYKEGTFTATLKGGTSDPTTPVTVTGNYVLVGKTMTVTVYFANVTTTGAAGHVYITTDLAAALRPGTRGTAAVGLEVFTTGAGVGSFIDVRTDGTFYLLENFNNGTSAIGQHNAGTNRYLWFTATYIIA